MLDKILGFFTGSGMNSIENIAKEWIETDQEKAEAKTLMIKTLDPNGMMRRQLSRDVTNMYKLYLIVTLVLICLESFGVGPIINEELAVSAATSKLTDLFAPITTLFGVIVSASFGVNYANTKQNK